MTATSLDYRKLIAKFLNSQQSDHNVQDYCMRWKTDSPNYKRQFCPCYQSFRLIVTVLLRLRSRQCSLHHTVHHQPTLAYIHAFCIQYSPTCNGKQAELTMKYEIRVHTLSQVRDIWDNGTIGPRREKLTLRFYAAYLVYPYSSWFCLSCTPTRIQLVLVQ